MKDQITNAKCPSCRENVDFVYKGPFFINETTLDPQGIKDLYDCSKCGTTRTYQTIILKNMEKLDL